MVPEVVRPKDDFRIVVRQVLKIGDDLNVEFRRQAELYGRMSWFSAEAKRNVRELKNELEVVSAGLRKLISRKSDSRVTKDEMQAALMRKKAYRRTLKRLNDALYHEDLVQGILRALEHKKDALVGLGANYRHELPEELRLLQQRLKKRNERRGVN